MTPLVKVTLAGGYPHGGPLPSTVAIPPMGDMRGTRPHGKAAQLCKERAILWNGGNAWGGGQLSGKAGNCCRIKTVNGASRQEISAENGREH